ncbi:MAG: right-handed parallel beta-helix repeat-containing protein, partial [Planctomycetota bacterium]
GNIFEITGVNDGADTVDVTPSPGSASGQAWSIGGAWATIDKAMNTVAAGDKVWVKADGNYNEQAIIDTAGTVSAPIEFEGYTSTTGDGGQATIDAQSTRQYCVYSSSTVARYHIFKNFIFQKAALENVGFQIVGTIFKNCRFYNSTGDGCASGSTTVFENCLFDSNGGVGADCTSGTAVFIGCRFENNTAEGIEHSGGPWIFDCTFVGNGGDAIECLGGNGQWMTVLNCTIDGDGKTTNTGIDCNSSFWKRLAIINCIVYDCVEGIDCASQGEYFVSRNNLLSNNTFNYPGSRFQTFEGEVLTAPQFADEAGGDYSLGASSPALDAGFDGYLQNGSTQRADIGAIESTAPIGAGVGGGSSRALKDGSQMI